MSAVPVFEHFRALGTAVAVGAVDPVALAEVVAIVRREIDACDGACSRFRADSELSRLNAGERQSHASEWFCDALATAIDAAIATDGLVDPTIGQCLIDLGYDRSFERLDLDSTLAVDATHVPAWRRIDVDWRGRRVAVPTGVRLDLGATAKALCADRAAELAAAETDTGVLVSLGGDIAVAGEAPPEGWAVRVTDRADTDTEPGLAVAGQTVTIVSGGLATSGTTARRWVRAGTMLHHVVDPRTGRPAENRWRTVSVAAPSCVAANTASTAAIILGVAAPAWLAARGFDARLVGATGDVVRTGAWPRERSTRGEVAA
jgi:thiamine biosynthesis lipoprotein